MGRCQTNSHGKRVIHCLTFRCQVRMCIIQAKRSFWLFSRNQVALSVKKMTWWPQAASLAQMRMNPQTMTKSSPWKTSQVAYHSSQMPLSHLLVSNLCRQEASLSVRQLWKVRVMRSINSNEMCSFWGAGMQSKNCTRRSRKSVKAKQLSSKKLKWPNTKSKTWLCN